ncbi:MAG: AAA family ATPase, partial [Gammaproteobacteria bacterium]
MTTQAAIQKLKHHVQTHIIGQDTLVDRLLIALLCDGHLLVEGAPGLAKTRAIKVLSDGIDSDFHRVQFTPDLLPADLTGTEVYRPQDGSFVFQQGPLFHNLVLADEINRAPAKVQSALLEAMAERQITVGKITYPLPRLFMVMATQNPIEQEGTYPLPEAQLDRFLMHVSIGYPDANAESKILALARAEAISENSDIGNETTVVNDKISQQDIFEARRDVLQLHMAENLQKYLLHMVLATRNPAAYGDDLGQWLLYG